MLEGCKAIIENTKSRDKNTLSRTNQFIVDVRAGVEIDFDYFHVYFICFPDA
jgi:hypothetical protein